MLPFVLLVVMILDLETVNLVQGLAELLYVNGLVFLDLSVFSRTVLTVVLGRAVVSICDPHVGPWQRLGVYHVPHDHDHHTVGIYIL